MKFYYDVVPYGRLDIDNMEEDEIEKIVEAMPFWHERTRQQETNYFDR